jgi:hypothetical protein
MESKRKKSTSKISESGILRAYREYLLTEGKKPASVFKFCRDNGLKEIDFYSYFASFEALEKSIWKNYAKDVLSSLTGDSSYPKFSSREKILSFYFTLTETLKADRSYVLFQLREWKNPAVVPAFMKSFRKSVDAWIEGVMDAGKQSGEVAKRPWLDTHYDRLFWMHTMFILQFWSHDDSPGFENTDIAIEKSVNLAFDLIGKGVLDNALDFGKFLYQTAKN